MDASLSASECGSREGALAIPDGIECQSGGIATITEGKEGST